MTTQAVTLLENVLFESVTAAQAHAAQWVTLSQTDSTYATLDQVAAALAATPEAGIAEQVVRYYEGALGRVPSGAEVNYYVRIAEAGLSDTQIAQGASGVPQATWNQIAAYFAASPEFNYLTAGSNVIPLLYFNILGRSPSTDEVAFYQKALDAGTSVPTLVQYFVASPEYQGKVNPQIEDALAKYGVAIANGGGGGLIMDPFHAVGVAAAHHGADHLL